MKLYFAYGSNLDPKQMQHRCPGSAFFARASLPNHAIAFAGYSVRWGGGVATIVQSRGDDTEGALYVLDAAAIERLDRFEGCPWAYRRCRKVVVDDEGRRRVAEVYLQQRSAFARPSSVYAGVIRAAYKRLGFDVRPLQRAERGLS